MKMKNDFLRYLVVALFLSGAGIVTADAARKPPLVFDSYAVDEVNDLPAKKILLSTRNARTYKTVIETDGAKEANFAGYSRVVTWGCGTDCRGFAIVNKKTGIAYTAPNINSVVGIMNNDDDRLSFKSNSRLLVITGGINETNYGKFYYYWDDKRLKLLHKDALSE